MMRAGVIQQGLHASALLLGSVLLFFSTAAATAAATTFTVTNTNDSGAGSLRQAMLDAGLSADSSNVIVFAIPGSGVHTIHVLSALPPMCKRISIDGYSQTGAAFNSLSNGASNAKLVIELDGSNAGLANGLTFEPGSGGSVVAGLVINRFQGAGIYLAAGADEFDGTWARIWGNFIGTDVNGTFALGNGVGIEVDGGSTAIIGQDAAETAQALVVNVISGNTGRGVYFHTVHTGGTGSPVNIYNNVLGADATGTMALGNGLDGVYVDNLSSNPFRRVYIKQNVVASNGGNGIVVLGGIAEIEDNLIGVGVEDVNENRPALGNVGDGIYIGGTSRAGVYDHKYAPAYANGIAGIAHNGGSGLYIDGTSNVDVVNQGFAGNGGLGIDIAPSGTNGNDAGDADMGPNEQLNAPVLDSVSFDPVNGYGDVVGHLDSNPGAGVQVQFYLSDACDPTGFGEGARWLPSDALSDGTLSTDPSGHTDFSMHSRRFVPGIAVTAFARRFALNETYIVVSEFSNCVVAGESIFANGFDGSGQP